jgi:hypothetical protein
MKSEPSMITSEVVRGYYAPSLAFIKSSLFFVEPGIMTNFSSSSSSTLGTTLVAGLAGS